MIYINAASGAFHKFISYYPLKQGLKLTLPLVIRSEPVIYILLSIKTRIETA